MFIRLASKSLQHRKGSVLLTIFAMTISILVILGVEHIREQAKTSFASSVSGVDLIVGSRTGKINLLLYSVFRIGSPTANISWKSYQDIKDNNAVAWTVPISLGDSHKGYRVLGTNRDYFTHFHYGNKQALTFTQGQSFAGVFEVVLGSKVAEALNYHVGDKLTLSHGIGATSFTQHDEAPFQVVGILKPTGTPVDQTVHVSLQGLEAVHMPKHILNRLKTHPDDPRIAKTLVPKSITATMLGLNSKLQIFNFQRAINTNKNEPLTAILPGVVLSELWQSIAIFESSLRLISLLVFISALMGLSAMLLSSIRERKPEIKLLRMMGASPRFIYWFIELEAILITLISATLAIGLLNLSLWLSKSKIVDNYGLSINANVISESSLQMLGIILVLTLIAAIPSALSAFKNAKNH